MVQLRESVSVVESVSQRVRESESESQRVRKRVRESVSQGFTRVTLEIL